MREKNFSSMQIKYMQDWTPKWQLLSPNYCQETVAEIASWIAVGESGAVLGLPGMGKATLLNYLSYHPLALKPYLGDISDSIILVAVDLNNLPNSQLATFYRTVLRSFYEAGQRFQKTLQQKIAEVYNRHAQTEDAFWAQSGVREILLTFQREGIRIVLVFNHFDRFCQTATPQMGYSLYGLQDGFQSTLCYLVGLQQEVRFLPNPEQLGPLYGLLDTNISWTGPLNINDAQEMIFRLTGVSNISKAEIEEMLILTGGHPGLLRVVCIWWLAKGTNNKEPVPPLENWLDTLWSRSNIQHRLQQMWAALTQDEQYILGRVHRLSGKFSYERYQDTLNRLQLKGVCYEIEGSWRILGTLLTRFVETTVGQVRGRIWLDEQSDIIYQGNQPIKNLQPLEHSVLKRLVQFPYKRQLSSELMEAAWSEDIIYREGKPTEALYQIIRGIRKAIEPDPSNPVYVQTRRGRPEGGYQFYPEGRPNNVMHVD